MEDKLGTTQRCPTGSFAYTIKSGDTLFQLARINNTTVEAIMRINPGINPNNLQIGQIICIPRGTTPPPQPSCLMDFPYNKARDTLFRLSQQFGVSVDAIIRANPESIQTTTNWPGYIPGAVPPMPSCPNGFFYTIKAGDTLFRLSQQFNVGVDEIIRGNPGIDLIGFK